MLYLQIIGLKCSNYAGEICPGKVGGNRLLQQFKIKTAKYEYLNFYDHQGSHFAPHLVSKRMWNKVGGFSEEFNPGIGSDPDFNMKLWHEGVRIFKGLNDFKVYHFGSITTRKKKNFIKNKGDITFLNKWGITTKFFKKHYLKSKTRFDGPLLEPKMNFYFLFDLLICKIKKLFIIN